MQVELDGVLHIEAGAVDPEARPARSRRGAFSMCTHRWATLFSGRAWSRCNATSRPESSTTRRKSSPRSASSYRCHAVDHGAARDGDERLELSFGDAPLEDLLQDDSTARSEQFRATP